MLITPQGEYLTNQFTGPNGTWTLIGSESISDKKGAVMQTLDTFTDDKGNYKTLPRNQVAKLYQDKKIWL